MRFSSLRSLGVSVLVLGIVACGEDDSTPNMSNNAENGDTNNDTSNNTNNSSTNNSSTNNSTTINSTTNNETTNNHQHTTNNHQAPEPSVWYFSEAKGQNAWFVTIVNPTTGEVLNSMELPELSAITASEADGGNGAGPGWGDVNVGPKGKIFANAMNADRVAVFNAKDKTFNSLLEVGPRPVHIYHPNHSMEIWTHADGIGAFHVINPDTLEVSEPIVAAANGTGHGKLLYAYEIRPRFFATNTTGPGVFPIDGVSREVGEMITVCGMPCAEDETKLCGGTHDKAYNPAKNWALFQCSGAAYGTYAIVDAGTNEVVHDTYSIAGGVVASKSNEFIFLIDGDTVQIWDTKAENHNGLDFDAVVTIEGAPNARGVQFSNVDDEWFAWLPLTNAPSVARLNLQTMEVTLIEVGALTKPPGASHFGRRATIGGEWLATYADDGVKLINTKTLDVVTGIKPEGLVSRVEFMAPH